MQQDDLAFEFSEVVEILDQNNKWRQSIQVKVIESVLTHIIPKILMKNRIYFFSNFGDWGKQPYGGGEVGNRRTLKLLKDSGFDVIVIEKYKKARNHSFFNILLLIARMLLNIIRFFCVLFFGRRKHSFVHIVGFYGPMVCFEYVLVNISKFLGYATVYEMRGGGAEDYYNHGSMLYKNCFSRIIKLSDCVFSQGLENYPLIDEICPNKNKFYYPNFVMTDFMPSKCPIKSKKTINIIYFGRVSRSKNVIIALETLKILLNHYNGVNLYIIGNYEDKDYYNGLIDFVRKNHLQSHVSFFPACDHEQLKTYLQKMHFYVFPTSEPHEGHSNALTESMAWGVIPIASSHGFNKSVVGDADLIVDELSPNDFAKMISSIIDNGLVFKYSSEVYNRVLNNYTSIVASIRLANEYNLLFKKMNS